MGCGDLRALGYPTGQQKLICHLDQLTSDALAAVGRESYSGYGSLFFPPIPIDLFLTFSLLKLGPTC